MAAACDSSIHFLDPATGSRVDAIDGAHDAAILSMEWAPTTIPIGKYSQCCLLCFLWTQVITAELARFETKLPYLFTLADVIRALPTGYIL